MVQRAALQRQCEFQILPSNSLNTDILSTDPSVPSPGGARSLTALPVEILRFITANLDPIAHHGLRGSCPTLHLKVDAPPLMSHGEYIQFHKQYEAHHRKKLSHLLCPFCNIFKKSTPSKTTFTDAQAVQNYSGKRTCVECGIANGHYDRRDLVIKKKKLFLCGGCKLMLPLEKEDRVVAPVVMTKGYPYHDTGWGRGAEITFDSGGKRWCKTCRVVIANLGDSGAMKMKQVYMP